MSVVELNSLEKHPKSIYTENTTVNCVNIFWNAIFSSYKKSVTIFYMEKEWIIALTLLVCSEWGSVLFP